VACSRVNSNFTF